MRFINLIFSLLLSAHASVTLTVVGRVQKIANGRLILKTQGGQIVRIKMTKLSAGDRKRVAKQIGSQKLMEIALVPEEFTAN